MSTPTECQHGTFTTIALPSDAETLAYQARRMAEQHGPATELTPHGDHLDVHQPKPVIAPGTAGTATVRGVEGVRVMRNDHNGGAWYSGHLVDEWRLHRDEFVTDFVPDAPSACADHGISMCPKMAYSNKQIQRELAEARAEASEARNYLLAEAEPKDAPGYSLHDLADSVTTTTRNLRRERDDARAEVERLTEAADAAEERARLAERDARAEHAEVEREKRHVEMLQERIDAVLNLADQWKAAQKENTAALARHELLPAKTPDADDFRYAATGCLEVPPVQPNAAPEPRPAFVLPEREVVRKAVEQIVLGLVRGAKQYEAVDAVLALLAEHAVTEERLSPVLHKVMTTHAPGRRWAELAQDVLAGLTGKAEG